MLPHPCPSKTRSDLEYDRLLGALAALWYGGVLQRLSITWVVIVLVIVTGLGIMLAISAGKPEITRE